MGWNYTAGMAASSQEKDYVHLLCGKLRDKFGADVNCRFSNLAEFERNPETYDLRKIDKLLEIEPGKQSRVAKFDYDEIEKSYVLLAELHALALQFAWAMAAAGKKVGFFSLETDSAALTDRILAERQVAAVNLPRSKAKKLTDADWRAVTGAAMRPAELAHSAA